MRDIDTRRLLLRAGPIAAAVGLAHMISTETAHAQRHAPYKETSDPTPEQIQARRIISGLSLLFGIPTMIGVPIWLLRLSNRDERRATLQSTPVTSEVTQNRPA